MREYCPPVGGLTVETKANNFARNLQILCYNGKVELYFSHLLLGYLTCIEVKNMTDPCEKTKKAPTRLWQILFMSLGSLLSVLFLIDFTSSILGGLGAISFLSFLLTPTLFAFPIIIKKLKLLIIPAMLFPLSFAIISISVFYPRERSGMIWFFCIVSACIAAFGIAAGFLIRLFHSGRRNAKILPIAVGGLALLTPVLFIGYMSAGAPIHSMPANRIVREYVAQTYSEFDVIVDRTWYDWYDGKYITRIFDKDDRDIYFEVWYITKISQWNPTHIIDRYPYGDSWQTKLEKMITPLLEEEFGDVLRYVVDGHELFGFYVVVGGVNIGQPFDKDAPVEIEGNFSVSVKDTEPETLAAEFIKYRDFIEKNDFTFSSYLFRFTRPDDRGGIHINLRAEYINNDLAELIEYMQNNLDDRGSYYDGDSGLRYTDLSLIRK